MEWPKGVERPQFSTRVGGIMTGEDPKFKRGANTFELWESIFADGFVLFQHLTRPLASTKRMHGHLRRFGLQMRVGLGAEASKNGAKSFPAIRVFARGHAPQGPLQPAS
jgi:hypothetical protein